MRKRYHKYHQNGRIYQANRGDSARVKPSKPRKKTIRFVIFSLLIVFLIMVGYIVYSSLSATNNIFAGGISLDSLINRDSLKQTDGITNILLLGKGGSNHPGGQLTDVIMLVRLRHKDNKVAMISIPRDLYITIPGYGQAKIN